MNVSEALDSRLSVRAFLDEPVAEETVREILERASRAPSGGNLQPWQVIVLSGAARERLLDAVARKMPHAPKGEGTEYNIYPPDLKEPYRSRRFRIGEMMYEKLGIPREDKAARLMQFAHNYRFFGAPVGLLFTIDRTMQEGQWADLGMFMQSIMLLAREYGLDTCPQEAWAVWYRTIGELFAIPEEHMLFCGMALGYRDPDAPVNRLRSERAPLSEFARFIRD
ncbi:MAG TPA: nitroreductase [Woeseiaceae bacterium]|nr:nitroreductase [Woeseiaceae bacterium]